MITNWRSERLVVDRTALYLAQPRRERVVDEALPHSDCSVRNSGGFLWFVQKKMGECKISWGSECEINFALSGIRDSRVKIPPRRIKEAFAWNKRRDIQALKQTVGRVPSKDSSQVENKWCVENSTTEINVGGSLASSRVGRGLTETGIVNKTVKWSGDWC